MASKFVELEEAAAMLRVTPDELNEMRLSGQIHAMRDGSSWKFKQDEVERVADEKGIDLSGGDDAEIDLGDVDATESDLALDFESGTAIGDAPAEEPESDLDLTIDEPGGSGLALEEDLGLDTESSDVALIPDDDGSGLNLVADSSADVLGGTDLNLESDSGGGTGELDFEGSDLGLQSDLSLDADDEISLGDDDDDLTIGDDDELALDDDDELVLDGGSDITGGAGDTGINLTSPSDSGLNLEEEPLDLAGSSVSSLELPEDDDIIDLDDLDAGPDEDTQLQVDEDFQLAPSMEVEDDEDDSGSQVIALEDSEAFLGEAGVAALEEDDATLGVETDDLEEALVADQEDKPVTQAAIPDSVMLAAHPEMPYSIWNVLSLLVIVMILSITGMLMMDLVRNMWSWDQPYTASTSIMDMMVKTLGLGP